MELANKDVSVNSLNGLLLDAMNQSRALFNKLEDQTKTIDLLRRENEQLRHDLEILREGNKSDQAAHDASAQLDHLFQQDAEKQAEIERLKAELSAASRDRARERSKSSQLVSPATSSDGIVYATGSHAPDVGNVTSKRALEEPARPISSIAWKRPRTEEHARVLQELSNNAVSVDRTRHAHKGKDRSTRGAEAIPIVTEDGEDHNRKENESPASEFIIGKKESGVHGRLGALLSKASPNNSTLAKPEQRSAKSVSPRTPVQRVPSLTESSSDIASASKTERPPGMRFLRPARHHEYAPEDDEPLRSRPLQRLNLSHFRLNPAYQGHYEPALVGARRNKEQKKCLPGCTRPECCGSAMKALVLTLGPDLKISDDDLLMDFLGPGSERNITTLTSVARENLLHEARVKQVADTYGKMHRNGRDRAVTPTGFWSTDMPGSQETKNQREAARQEERAEVKRRHQEASKHDGKWIFADEL